MTDRSPILLYDGSCGFCARSVQFVLDHERDRRSLRFARLEGPLGESLRARRPDLKTVDSVLWFEPRGADSDGEVFARSAAVLRVLRYLGGRWRGAATVSEIVPRPIRDWVYDVVARYRKRILKRSPSCLLPTPEQRARFLD